MISDHMREIARKEKFTRQDLEGLLANLTDHIRISHIIALQDGSDVSPYEDDNECALTDSVVLTREALFELNELLFPPCELELARRETKLQKTRLAQRQGFSAY